MLAEPDRTALARLFNAVLRLQDISVEGMREGLDGALEITSSVGMINSPQSHGQQADVFNWH